MDDTVVVSEPVSQPSQPSEEVPMAEREKRSVKKTVKRTKKATKATKATDSTAEKPLKKADAVRAYLEAHPEAKNPEIVAALAAHGIALTTNYVSVIRGQGKKKGRGRKKLSAPTTLKEVLRSEKAALLKRVEAIDTLLG
jgi:hypothetical protein